MHRLEPHWATSAPGRPDSRHDVRTSFQLGLPALSSTEYVTIHAQFGANGRIIGHQLQAENVKTHQIDWSFSGDGNLTLSPIIVDNYVFVASSKGILYGLDGATGKQIWSGTVGYPVVYGLCCWGPDNSLAAANGYIFVPAPGTLVAFK